MRNIDVECDKQCSKENTHLNDIGTNGEFDLGKIIGGAAEVCWLKITDHPLYVIAVTGRTMLK